jgi:hypothetical protein
MKARSERGFLRAVSLSNLQQRASHFFASAWDLIRQPLMESLCDPADSQITAGQMDRKHFVWSVARRSPDSDVGCLYIARCGHTGGFCARKASG